MLLVFLLLYLLQQLLNIFVKDNRASLTGKTTFATIDLLTLLLTKLCAVAVSSLMRLIRGVATDDVITLTNNACYCQCQRYGCHSFCHCKKILLSLLLQMLNCKVNATTDALITLDGNAANDDCYCYY